MITILLVDDHVIMRQGLSRLIENEADMRVVAEADDGRTAVQLAQEFFPDVVIMDVTLPDLNGIEATRQIFERVPTTKIIALSMHPYRIFVTEMIEAGASGYLLKSCVFDELVQAIRATLKNQTFYSPDLLDEKSPQHSEPSLSENKTMPLSVLTNREREVLQLIAEGKTNKEIASLLFITKKTVEKHRMQIKQKLNLHSTAEITKYAIRQHLTTLNE